jgi:hypothetical protein
LVTSSHAHDVDVKMTTFVRDVVTLDGSHGLP